MKVVLISHTPRPEFLAALAAKLCYSSINIDELSKKMSSAVIKKRLRDCFKKGHLSIFEHASFTFAVEGISRTATHQLVRHRIASYSQQSQRYVKLTDQTEYILPGSIKKNSKIFKTFKESMKSTFKNYQNLISQGIKPEDARFILPQAVATKIIITMNARELFHFFGLRCCTHAQWEIRALAYKMLSLVKKIAPVIFEEAGPRCLHEDKCPEGDNECFKKMKKSGYRES